MACYDEECNKNKPYCFIAVLSLYIFTYIAAFHLGTSECGLLETYYVSNSQALLHVGIKCLDPTLKPNFNIRSGNYDFKNHPDDSNI
jgi:hypothetical protein